MDKVQVPIESRIRIDDTGNSIMLGEYCLKEVLYVPDFKFNLLSVAKLTKDLKCMGSFYHDLYVLQALFSGKVIAIGRVSDGLYILKDHTTPPIGAVTSKIEDQELWHLRLGHPSIKAMKHIMALKNKVDIVVHQECLIYPLVMQCRLKFPISDSKSSSIFELIHMNVWGPHRHPT